MPRGGNRVVPWNGPLLSGERSVRMAEDPFGIVDGISPELRHAQPFMKLASLLALLPLAVLFAPADAKACGGCFHGEEATPTQSPSVITDHRMVLAITPSMTTLWDQVEYAGDPSEFAWVLPIRGRVTVGIGADSFITALDNGTAPVVRAPPSSCPPVAVPDSSGGVGCGASADKSTSYDVPSENGGLGWQEDSGVYVTDRSVVGPYETVQVHGKDAGGILGWLRANKYVVPTELEPMLQKYVDEGFDFVAVRLRPGVGVHAMRPIRVSFKGAYPSLPLRMVRAGVGDNVGIKLFVVADGRWQTANFPTLAIDPKMLTWDFSAGRSDYVTIRGKESAKFDNRAFVVESSIDMTSSAIPYEPAPGYPDPPKADADIPAVDSGAPSDAASDGDLDAASSDADLDAATDAPVVDTAPPEYDAGEKPNVDPYASDTEVAFGTYTMRRVTRLRADLPSRYLDVDLVLEADENQSALLPTLQVTKGINEVCASNGGGSGGSSDTCDCTVPVTSSPVRMPVALCAAALALALVRRKR